MGDGEALAILLNEIKVFNDDVMRCRLHNTEITVVCSWRNVDVNYVTTSIISTYYVLTRGSEILELMCTTVGQGLIT
jgi:hypothetical protein